MADSRTIQLLIVDPQNDFCDISGAALPVPGAAADLQRLAELIGREGAGIDAIHVTLDSHHPLDIAHPWAWRDEAGRPPPPFTVIDAEAIVAGRWRMCDPARRAKGLEYVTALAARGRYPLMIWPEHCLIGSWGHNVYAPLFAALNDWTRQTQKPIRYVPKGANIDTEHYSAVQAEIPDAGDACTLPDTGWLAQLASPGTLLVAGEALSHCVAGTVRDIADHFEQTLPAASRPELVLLTDCSSPVSGFTAAAGEFVAGMRARGMRLERSTEFASES